jgi:hypothetical protein
MLTIERLDEDSLLAKRPSESSLRGLFSFPGGLDFPFCEERTLHERLGPAYRDGTTDPPEQA